jgi:hypothetical protein
MRLHLLIRIGIGGAVQPLSHTFILCKWALPSLLVEANNVVIFKERNQPLSTCSIKNNMNYGKLYVFKHNENIASMTSITNQNLHYKE